MLCLYGEMDGRPLADLALCPNSAAHQFNQCFAFGKTHALICGPGIDAGIEEVIDLVRRDAGACIFDLEMNLVQRI